MRLIAYDLEALVRVAQQAPWRDGHAEVSAWLADVRRAARPEGGFGRGDGDARRFDAARLDAVAARLSRAASAFGRDDVPLRELAGEDPDREVTPGWTGWDAYEDLVRVWTVLVSPPWPDAALTADAGPAALLGPLGRSIDRDLRLTPGAALLEDVGMPYPVSWQRHARARIRNVQVELLDHLCEIGRADVERAASETGRAPDAIAADVGRLIRHCELARQLDTVVAIDPDDSFWA